MPKGLAGLRTVERTKGKQALSLPECSYKSYPQLQYIWHLNELSVRKAYLPTVDWEKMVNIFHSCSVILLLVKVFVPQDAHLLQESSELLSCG